MNFKYNKIIFYYIISSFIFFYSIFFSLIFIQQKKINYVNSYNIINSTIPLYKYKISTSHNSFIRGFQNFDIASTHAIEYNLHLGARCIELDIYDYNNIPFIAHGIKIFNRYLFTTNLIKLKDALITIKKFSDLTSDPILIYLQLETNNNIILHEKISTLIHDIFTNKLLSQEYKLAKKKIFFLEPIHTLLNKIIIIGGFINEINGLENILDISLKQNLFINNDHIKILNFNISNQIILSRIYHKGNFFSELSLNYAPHNYWNHGHQLVAFNLQTNDLFLKKYLEYFNNSSFIL